MRVTPQLEIIDTVFISNVDGGQNIPAVAFNGSDHIVVFVDARFPKGIVASRVSTQGAVLDTGYTINDGNNNPDVASDSVRSLAVWSREYSGVWARFVDAQAMPSDTAFRISPILASSTDPAVGYGGGVYLTVWSDYDMPGGDLDVFGQALSPSGLPIGGMNEIVRRDGVQKNPSVAFTGSDFLVAWQDGFDRVYCRRVGTDGKPIGEPFLVSDTILSCEKQNPAIAAFNTRFLAVWAEYRGGFDLYGSVDDPIAVAEGPGGSKPAAALLPAVFLSAEILMEYRGNAFYDAVGRSVDPEHAGRGVYFIRIDEGTVLKAIKLK